MRKRHRFEASVVAIYRPNWLSEQTPAPSHNKLKTSVLEVYQVEGIGVSPLNAENQLSCQVRVENSQDNVARIVPLSPPPLTGPACKRASKTAEGKGNPCRMNGVHWL